MKMYLSSGVEVDITTNNTGGVDVNVVCPPKNFNNIQDSLKDLYETVYGALVGLNEEGILGSGQPGKKIRHINPSDSLPSFKFRRVIGPDGQFKLIRETPPPTKKPAVHKKKAPLKNADTAKKPEPSRQTSTTPPELFQFAPHPINQQSSTYVAPTYHADMLKPGQALSELQIAGILFPEQNETIVISVEARVGSEDINIGPKKDLKIEPEQTSKREMDIDLGLFEYKTTTTEKTYYQEVDVYDSYTRRSYGKTLMPTSIREEKSYKAINVEGVGGVEEERNVYIEEGGWEKLVISQYRIGFTVGIDKKAELSKNIGLRGGIEIEFNSPWINNPIPKQEPPPPATIGPEDYH